MAGRLTEIESNNLTELYETRYDEFGMSYKTVGWGSKTDQTLRFDMLCRGLDLTGKSILDVGCGLGDLVPYLETRYGDDFKYVGIDIVPAFITQAQSDFNQPNVKFLCAEMSELDENEGYDVALLSGSLSFKIEDNIGYTNNVLTKLFQITKEAVSANFLSTYVDYQEEKNFHYSPEEMFSFAKSLTSRVALYHDYPLWEFTLQIRHLEE